MNSYQRHLLKRNLLSKLYKKQFYQELKKFTYILFNS